MSSGLWRLERVSSMREEIHVENQSRKVYNEGAAFGLGLQRAMSMREGEGVEYKFGRREKFWGEVHEEEKKGRGGVCETSLEAAVRRAFTMQEGRGGGKEGWQWGRHPSVGEYGEGSPPAEKRWEEAEEEEESRRRAMRDARGRRLQLSVRPTEAAFEDQEQAWRGYMRVGCHTVAAESAKCECTAGAAKLACLGCAASRRWPSHKGAFTRACRHLLGLAKKRIFAST